MKDEPTDATLLAMIARAARYYKRMFPCQTLWTDEEVDERAAFEAVVLRESLEPSSTWFVFHVLQRMQLAFKREVAERERRQDADLDEVSIRQEEGVDDVLIVCERVFKMLEEQKANRTQTKHARNRAVVERCIFGGATMDEAAREFGITRARVFEIVDRFRKAFSREWEKEQ